MAYDEQLAQRIRDALAGELDVAEKRMFGGLAFLIAGNMAVAVSGQGGLLLRVPPEETDRLLEEPHAEVCVMRERPMDGWLRIAPEGTVDDAELRRWVDVGRDTARALPPK